MAGQTAEMTDLDFAIAAGDMDGEGLTATTDIPQKKPGPAPKVDPLHRWSELNELEFQMSHGLHGIAFKAEI